MMLEGLNEILARISQIKSLFGVNQTYPPNNDFKAVLEGAAKDTDIEKYVAQASSIYGVDPNLIKAVIKAESGFKPDAVSRAGAMGLMQLMPETAREMGIDPLNPGQNIMGGTAYLKKMLDAFGDDVSLALAAYNAGPANVEKYKGIPPFPETREYIKKVAQYYQEFSKNKTENFLNGYPIG